MIRQKLQAEKHSALGSVLQHQEDPKPRVKPHDNKTGVASKPSGSSLAGATLPRTGDAKLERQVVQARIYANVHTSNIF